MSTLNIPREVRDLLGVGNDASAFAMAAFRKFTAPLRTIYNRAIARHGLKGQTITIEDADPRKAGKQSARLRWEAFANDSPAELAAKFAVFVTRGRGAGTLNDEAMRWMLGLGQGPAVRTLDSGEVEIERLDPAWAKAMGPAIGTHSLEPTTMAAIGAVIVPLLCAAIPLVLPMIIEWGIAAFDMIGDAAVDATKDIPGLNELARAAFGKGEIARGSGEAPPPPPPPDDALIFGLERNTALMLLGAAAVAALVFVR